MAAQFMVGWTATTEFMALLCGGLCAVLLAALITALVLALLVCILGAAFDAATNARARRWEKKGRHPAGRWAEIIAKGKH